jgi:FkbM family methyltransferase
MAETGFMPDTPARETFPLRCARALAQGLPKGRSAFVKSIARLTGAPCPFVGEVDQCRWLIDLNERVSRTLYLYGDFEPVLTKLLGSLLPPGGTFFDVGANFGYFSLFAARRIGPQGRVVAFEPDPRNIQRLQTNIALNGFSQIRVVPAAVCDKAGTASLHLASDAEDNLGTSSIVHDGPGRKTVNVPAIALDDFMTEFSGNIDVLKMDIEGAELSALRGAIKTLAARRIRHILLELHRFALTENEVATVHELLTSAGYRGFAVDAGLLPGASSATPLTALHHLKDPNPHLRYSLPTEPPAP